MSKDNTIIIGQFPDGYRIINAQACENLDYEEYVFDYFDGVSVVQDYSDAITIAKQMEKDDWAEYGIKNHTFPLSIEVYRYIKIGKAVADVVDTTFDKDIMQSINKDKHKSSDGIVNILYDSYSKDRTIYHNGYVRNKISSTEDDIAIASYKYCADIKQANYNELKDIEINKKIPQDRHVVIDEDSYELYHKGDIVVLGSIREGREDMIMEKIQEYNI